MKTRVDPVAKKMSEASALKPPKKGEEYRCEQCGMEILITPDCKCQDASHVEFRCCGENLHKV